MWRNTTILSPDRLNPNPSLIDIVSNGASVSSTGAIANHTSCPWVKHDFNFKFLKLVCLPVVRTQLPQRKSKIWTTESFAEDSSSSTNASQGRIVVDLPSTSQTLVFLGRIGLGRVGQGSHSPREDSKPKTDCNASLLTGAGRQAHRLEGKKVEDLLCYKDRA